jgi:5-(carboxyamino)imidazole ribonucleotide mutase
MPSGVPVATVALDDARNAGILAAQIIGSSDKVVAKRLDKFKKGLEAKVESSAKSIETKGWRKSLQ